MFETIRWSFVVIDFETVTPAFLAVGDRCGGVSARNFRQSETLLIAHDSREPPCHVGSRVTWESGAPGLSRKAARRSAPLGPLPRAPLTF